MLINVLIMVICIITSIFIACCGGIELSLLPIVGAIINLPMSIAYFNKKYFGGK